VNLGKSREDAEYKILRIGRELCHSGGGGRMETLANESQRADHYLTRAEELRVCAEAMTSVEARALLLEIAQHYVRLAAALTRFGTNEIG
jgi:hypothetical protein